MFFSEVLCSKDNYYLVWKSRKSFMCWQRIKAHVIILPDLDFDLRTVFLLDIETIETDKKLNCCIVNLYRSFNPLH